MSARLVTRPGGEVEEIHLLTTEEVAPKQTVRNVESALLARLDLHVDHRKISVAQARQAEAVAAPAPAEIPGKASVAVLPEPGPAETRLLFVSHQLGTERARKVKHRVEIEWRGEAHVGEAGGADLPRARLDAVAEATLRAVEKAISGEGEGSPTPVLALDGVKTVEAFDRTFILVAVHAMSGREVTPLAGATVVEESTDRAAILATLQATDRWVRGRI